MATDCRKFDIPITGIAVTTCSGFTVVRRSGSAGMDFPPSCRITPGLIRLTKLARLHKMSSTQSSSRCDSSIAYVE